MPRPLALITGASGQDAGFLAERLVRDGTEVVGTSHGGPSSPSAAFSSVERLDLGDHDAIVALIRRLRPTHLYNLAGMTSGARMFDDAHRLGLVNGHAVVSLLEAIRTVDPGIRLFQASSSEMFRGCAESPQSESTPFAPRSPYGAAKLHAHWMVRIYRERHGLHACSGILFNHESPRRGLDFVSRIVTRGAARIRLGLQRSLELGDLDARRDWGHAADFVEAYRAMLLAPEPRDYVIGTGVTHSVSDLCEIAFSALGLHWRDHVGSAPASGRTADGVTLVADARRITADLGWSPTISFETMIRDMALADLHQLESNDVN